MNQIARYDWLPERARWNHLARSGLPAVSRKQNFPKSHIINPLLTKFVRTRWLDIGLFFGEFMDLDFVSVHKHAKKELGQYPAILTSHLVNNPYLLFIQNISLFPIVKTTRIIPHNQLLFTKFGMNLRHIESMTSKVQPAADYWTNDRKNLVTRLRYIWLAAKQIAKWRSSFKKGEIFWMDNKGLLNSAFVGYEEFCRSRRALSTSSFGLYG